MPCYCCRALRDRPAKIIVLVSLVLGLLASGTGGARADDVTIAPTLGVKQEYNDNLFYNTDKTGDFMTTCAPGIDLRDRSERLDALLSTSVKGVRFWQNSRYSTVDYTLFANTRYRVAPRLEISATAEYDRFSGPSKEVGPAAIVINTVRRYHQYYSFQNEYQITQKTSGSAGYAYTQNDYVTAPLQVTSTQSATPPVVNPPVPPTTTPPDTTLPGGSGGSGGKDSLVRFLSAADAKIHAPFLSLAHVFDEKTKGSATASYTSYLYRYSTVENKELSLGVSRALNELWNLSLKGGVRQTTSQSTPVKRTYQVFPFVFTDETLARHTERSWGWVGQCALAYGGETGGGSLSVYRDVFLGRLSANETTGVMLEGRRRLSYELEGNLSVGYQLNRARSGEFGSESVRDDVFQLRAGLRYDITRDAALEVSYANSSASIAGVNISQNSALVNLVMKWPLFE
jgi:hypothetical protein